MIRHSFPGLVHFSYMKCLQAGRQRIVYLITYSRADVVKFPSKESFSRAVQRLMCIEAYYNTDNGQDGENINLYHYHIAIKQEKRVRWFQIRKYLQKNLIKR